MTTRALVILLALLLTGLACNSGGADDVVARAIATVSHEVVASNASGVSPSDLTATRIPRGAGAVVYVKNPKPTFVWVVLDGQAYATNQETKSLTPRAPYTSEARWDTWKQTGLDPTNTAAFAAIVSAAEAGRTP